MQYILFFVIAKPVDTAISGALGLVSRYLGRAADDAGIGRLMVACEQRAPCFLAAQMVGAIVWGAPLQRRADVRR